MSAAANPKSQVSKPLLIVLGLAALLAAAYLVLVLPNRGADTAAPVDPAAPATGSEPVVADVGSEPVAEPTAPPDGASEIADAEPTFEVFSARDPFDQLVAEDTGAVGDTTTTSSPVDSSGGTTTTTTPTDTSAPSTSDPAQPTTTTPDDGEPAQTSVGTTTIMLEETFSDGGVATALVRVDDEGYEAAEGETVVGDLTVLDIEGNCATMRFEDRRFILCEGEQIRK